MQGQSIKKSSPFFAEQKIQVTASDYCDFLNHVANYNSDFLYDEAMSSDFQTAWIMREGLPGSYRYFVLAGREKEPVAFVGESDQEAYIAWLGLAEKRPVTKKCELVIDRLRSNQNGFEILLPPSTSLSVASTYSQDLTSELSPSDFFFLLPLIAMVGRENGIETTANHDAIEDQLAPPLQIFRERISNPENHQAERLILRNTAEGVHLEASDGNGETQFQIRSDDNATRKELKRALEQAGLSKKNVHNLVSEVLPYRGVWGYLRGERLPLTHDRLRTIINRVDHALSELNNDVPVELDHVPVELDDLPLEEESTVVSNFQKLIDSLLHHEVLEQELHFHLKNLQKSRRPISFHNHWVLWDNQKQLFIEHPNEEKKDDVFLQGEISLETLLQRLNDYVDYDKRERRADLYAIEEQDTHQPQLLDELLSTKCNPRGYSLLIAHHGVEDLFSSKVSSSEEEVEGDLEHFQSENKPILLFGFNVPGKSGPRQEIKENLKAFKITCQDMRHYNQAVSLKSITVEKYLSFIDEAKRGVLANRLTQKEIDQFAQKNIMMTLDQGKAWAAFLSKHENLSSFDFSEKLRDPESKKRFIVKNHQNITKLDNVSDFLRESFKTNNWDSIIDQLNPALNLLVSIGDDLIKPVLSEPELKVILKDLKKKYKDFSNQPNQKDLEITLNSILYGAFFRKTSKLGLEFAKSFNIPVGFVWKHYFSDTLPSTLNELHDYLERKPYYFLNYRRSNKVNADPYPEAITCSEMRHLGRLMLKSSEREGIRTAPDYLLIKDITLPEDSSVMTIEESK